MTTSIIVSIIALGASGIAALGTGFIAWFGSIRPIKIVGVLSKLDFEIHARLKGGGLDDELITLENIDENIIIKITPFLLMKNVGVQNAIVELMRISFNVNNKCFYYANLDTEMYNKKSGEGLKRIHFIGNILSANETWTNFFPFSMTGGKFSEFVHHNHQNNVQVKFEVKLVGKNKWKRIKLNEFNFDLRLLQENISQLSFPVYSNIIRQNS